jgi:hypothetical protein
MIGSHPSPGPDRAAGGPGEGAGLVTYKTSSKNLESGHFGVSFHPNECALRRISRLKRSVWASGRLHGLANSGFRPPVCWFVTLTYAGIEDWRANHVSEALKAYREWCRVKGVPCRYTWVAELQQRGAVHYHMLAWLPPGVRMPKWDRSHSVKRILKSGKVRVRVFAPFWSHGMTERDEARSGVGYLMKYLSKLGEFHRFPDGMRLYGIGGLDGQARKIRSWLNLAEWQKAGYGVGDLVRVAGRLVVQATGQLLDSIYRVQVVPGGLRVSLVGERPEGDFSGPYSSLNRGLCGAAG